MRGKSVQRRAYNYTCEGKERFSSYSLAAEIARRRSRSGKKNHVYRCGTCNTFHLGSNTGTRLRRHGVQLDDEVYA